jgi:hypothetical protein
MFPLRQPDLKLPPYLSKEPPLKTGRAKKLKSLLEFSLVQSGEVF